MKKNHPHLTAKDRDRASYPTNWLLSRGLIKGRVLDFGCGMGADTKMLTEKGYYCEAYDTHYNPEYPKHKFDTIICQYVFNVLELEHQEDLLLHITSLLATSGVAYVTVRRDIRYEGYRTHKIHKKTTYQRNVILPFPSIFKNDFCEIYQITRCIDKPKSEDCMFCNPPSKLRYIAESSNTVAFLDGFPVSKGHTLVVPKQHIADYFDVDSHIQNELWQAVNHLKKRIAKAYSPDGFNVGINAGEAAGQTVFHCHIHLIPRYTGDVDNPRGGVRHVIPGKGDYKIL